MGLLKSCHHLEKMILRVSNRLFLFCNQRGVYDFGQSLSYELQSVRLLNGNTNPYPVGLSQGLTENQA